MTNFYNLYLRSSSMTNSTICQFQSSIDCINSCFEEWSYSMTNFYNLSLCSSSMTNLYNLSVRSSSKTNLYNLSVRSSSMTNLYNLSVRSSSMTYLYNLSVQSSSMSNIYNLSVRSSSMTNFLQSVCTELLYDYPEESVCTSSSVTNFTICPCRAPL